MFTLADVKIISCFLFFFITFFSFAQENYLTVHRTERLMGGTIDFTVVAKDKNTANSHIETAILEAKRIEKIISIRDRNSETSKINSNAGIQPVKVSKELFNLIERAAEISEITAGAFDISYAALNSVWRFNLSMDYVPTAKQIASSVANVDYRLIVLNKEQQTVYLPKKEMKIGFGAIEKGFVIDKVKKLLQLKGVVGGVINVSGDLATWGTQISGKKWLVGIGDPLDKNEIYAWVPVLESAIATSKNYDKYIEYKGKKYSHIIDPRTGYPAKGIKSVSVFADKAVLADALATAVFVLGVEKSLEIIRKLKNVEVIIIDDANEIYMSSEEMFIKDTLH